VLPFSALLASGWCALSQQTTDANTTSSQIFEYNSSAALDVQIRGEEDPGPVIVQDLTYASPNYCGHELNDPAAFQERLNWLTLELHLSPQPVASERPDCLKPANYKEPADAAEARKQLNDLNPYLGRQGYDQTAVRYALSTIYAYIGDFPRAMALLRSAVTAGAGFDPSMDPAFKPIETCAAFREIVADVQRTYRPVSTSQIAFKVPAEKLIPEGLAYDPQRSVFYLSSLNERKIVRISSSGALQDFVSSGQDGLFGVLGMKVAPEDGSVWAASSDDSGHSGLFHFSYAGKLIEKLVPPPDSNAPHLFNDLVLLPNGEVFVTDSTAGVVYRKPPGGKTLAAYDVGGSLIYPNGIAISADNVVQNTSCILPGPLCPNAFSTDGNNQGPWLNRASWDHTFSPTLLNTFNAGYNDERGHAQCISQASVGMLPQIAGVYSHSQTPVITFENFTGFSCGGTSSYSGYDSRPVVDFNDMVTKVHGQHTFRLGGDFRAHEQNTNSLVDEAGTFNFTALNTGLLGLNSGSDVASFLLGEVGSADVNYPTTTTYQMRSKDYALFVSDTWKATTKLSVDYGVRWDLSTPAVDKYNRLSWFDPTRPNPGAGNRPGALVFAGTNPDLGSAAAGRTHPEYTYYKAFAPRLGVAYAVSEKTVVRAGYGIFYTAEAYSGWSAGAGQEEFNQTAFFSSSNGGLTPAFLLAQGIPQTFQKPPFFNLSAGNGQEGPLYRAFNSNRPPYAQQWNLTVENGFSSNFHVSTAYVGNKGTRLPSSIAPLNALNPSLLSMGQALYDEFQPGQNALDGVSVPYAGWVSQMTACPPTVAQALLPFPQYCGSLQGNSENVGNSTYHALQLQAIKRYSNGLWFTSSYTFSKMISDSGGPFAPDLSPITQNFISPFQQHRNKALSQSDLPQIFSLGPMYDLPFGKGKHFLNRGGALDKLIGGWQINTIFRATSGSPFVIYSSYCNVPDQFDATCLPSLLPGANPFLQTPSSYNPSKVRF